MLNSHMHLYQLNEILGTAEQAQETAWNTYFSSLNILSTSDMSFAATGGRASDVAQEPGDGRSGERRANACQRFAGRHHELFVQAGKPHTHGLWLAQNFFQHMRFLLSCGMYGRGSLVMGTLGKFCAVLR